MRVITTPHSGQIEAIRELKKIGDYYYKKLKETLPNFTPNCMVKERGLKDDDFDNSEAVQPRFWQYLVGCSLDQ